MTRTATARRLATGRRVRRRQRRSGRCRPGRAPARGGPGRPPQHRGPQPQGMTRPSGDGIYGRGRGKPLVFAVLGDSSAVGLGVERADRDPRGAHRRGARRAGRAPGAPGPAGRLRRRVAASSTAQVDQALAEHPDVALIMIGANDVTSRTRPAVSVRAPGRRGPPADRGRLRGRRRHLPRPRHDPADRPAAADLRPPLEPAAGRGADHRRRRGRRAHRVAGLGARPGVRLRPQHVQRRRVPPQRRRLRAGRRRPAAVGRRRRRRLAGLGRPRPAARSAAAPSGRSPRPRPGPPAAPAPRSSPPRSAAPTPARGARGRCCAAGRPPEIPTPEQAQESAEATAGS